MGEGPKATTAPQPQSERDISEGGERDRRSIPSLDGLRALSVFAVILGHTRSAFLDRIPFRGAFRNGDHGVAVFLVISGFLITHLLLKELRQEGQINLKRFYLRRTFRIFPPFYVYLLVIALLGWWQVVYVTPETMAAAATYTWNYLRIPDIWIVGHSWSLSLEEQFYLLWPACMKFFSRRTNFKIAIAVIALSPAIRVATYYAWPEMRGYTTTMLHTRLDTLMVGCFLSLAIDLNAGQRWRRLALHPAVPILAILFFLFVDPPIEQRWDGRYLLPLGLSLENLAVGAILVYAVFRHRSLLGRFLNWRVLRHFGRISYSLYLWQQLFTGPYTRPFPMNFLGMVVCAELSYFLVERPSFRIRERLAATAVRS
jgi:peptidoglycan/LPS O-acetylase OafA/YrhL